jgi:DNA-binding transcriptional LysR family regulator
MSPPGSDVLSRRGHRWLYFEKWYVTLALIVSRDKLLGKMELRHLRYFTAVAEHLNYSEASRRIHVVQPALSQTILDLEEELGVRLLFRDRRTVRLTAAGETLQREALEILRRNEEAARLTKRASFGEVGRLRIGFFASAVAPFLPALVQEYQRRFPDVELTLFELTPTQQLRAFDEGQLDVGFSRPLPAERSKEFHEELVYADYLHLVLPSTHPLTRNLAGDGTINIKRLSGERFVLLHRQAAPGLYDDTIAFCRRAGKFSPHVVNEAGLASTMLLLVESGVGVSLFPGSGRHLVRAGGLVVFCRLRPASASTELRMTWRRAAPSSPTVEAFREVMQTQREAIRALMEERPSEKKQTRNRVS